jgi:hypothetical protein
MPTHMMTTLVLCYTTSRLKGKQKLKVRALCVVNALTGPFFIDFTTGTSGFQRRHLPHNQSYQVRSVKN